jgi:hypothetical protein
MRQATPQAGRDQASATGRTVTFVQGSHQAVCRLTADGTMMYLVFSVLELILI